MSSFRLVADIEIGGDRNVAGTIRTQRLGVMDHFTDHGWALYFLDGHLVVTFNIQGTPERLTVTERTLAGTHQIELLHSEGSDANDHTISLAVNGRDVDAMDLSDNPLATQFRLGRLLVGRDYGTPVCDDYQPPFPFTGHIQRIVCEDLSQPKPEDLRQQIISTIEND